MTVTLLVTMLALGLSVLPASAQGIVYSSAYQIQNLEGSTATVLIQYYDQTSGNLAASGTITIDPNSSKTIFPFVSDGITAPSPTFNGSAVLSSDRQIAAILNTQTSSTPFYGASTNGFSAGALDVNLPLIACNNSGFDTWFNVQNAGTGNADFTVTYVPGANGAAGLSDNVSGLKPGAAKTFNQKAGSTTGTKMCPTLADGSGKFVGSAKVHSTNGQPLVASVMFLGTGSLKTLQGYNGFTAGSPTAALPLIMANNSSYWSAIQVQNAGTNSTNVTVTFAPNTAGANNPIPETFALAGGAAKTLLQIGGPNAYTANNWGAVGKYVGGATITQSGSEPLVAIVNQNSTTYTSLGSSYESFNPAAATGTIKMPLIAANNNGFFTSFQVQAASGNPAVTVHYATNSVGGQPLMNPVDDTFNLTTGSTKTLMQIGAPGFYAGNNNWSTAGKYVGAATVSATGGTIIAIVNFNGPASLGDTFFTYDGFNQ